MLNIYFVAIFRYPFQRSAREKSAIPKRICEIFDEDLYIPMTVHRHFAMIRKIESLTDFCDMIMIRTTAIFEIEAVQKRTDLVGFEKLV